MPAAAQEPAGPVTRIYSNIDDVRANKSGLCKTISRSGDEEQPVINEIVLKPTVITKDNYQPFDTPLEQRSCPTFEEASKLGAK